MWWMIIDLTLSRGRWLDRCWQTSDQDLARLPSWPEGGEGGHTWVTVEDDVDVGLGLRRGQHMGQRGMGWTWVWSYLYWVVCDWLVDNWEGRCEVVNIHHRLSLEFNLENKLMIIMLLIHFCDWLLPSWRNKTLYLPPKQELSPNQSRRQCPAGRCS